MKIIRRSLIIGALSIISVCTYAQSINFSVDFHVGSCRKVSPSAAVDCKVRYPQDYYLGYNTTLDFSSSNVWKRVIEIDGQRYEASLEAKMIRSKYCVVGKLVNEARPLNPYNNPFIKNICLNSPANFPVTQLTLDTVYLPNHFLVTDFGFSAP